MGRDGGIERLTSTADEEEDYGGDFNAPIIYKTFTDLFEEQFPYYLSIGMTAEQYWDGDMDLVIAYRKADELRLERTNTELWLQGMYFYDALTCTIGNAFCKKGGEKHEYAKKPYSITERQRENERRNEERIKSEQMLAQMKAFAKQFNARRKGESEIGRGDG